jgi:hypothetical protein
LSTLVATEAFKVDVALTPHTPNAAIIASQKLTSGIKCITRGNAGDAITNIDIAVMCGSSKETVSETGFSALLEAAAFAGTDNKSGLRMIRDLENLGVILDTSIDREKITYSISCLSEYTEQALEIVATAISQPVSARKYYTVDDSKALGQILTKEHTSNHTKQVIDLVYEAGYGESAGLGNTIYPDNMKKLHVEDVMAYRAKHFVSDNIVVAGSGISMESLKGMVDCYFHNMPSAKPTTTSSAFCGGDVKVRTDLDGETYLAVGFPLPEAAKLLPYQVLYSHLSSVLASQGFPKYAIDTFYEPSASGGLFGIISKGHTGAAVENLTKALGAFKGLASSSDASHAMKVTMSNMNKLEGSGSSKFLLQSAISNIAPEALADARKVSAGDVQAAAKGSLSAGVAYAVYGATVGTPNHSSIAAMLK